MKTFHLALATALILAFSTSAWGNCSSSDFGVENLDISVENCSGRNCPRLALRGALINHCSEAAGARIEIEAETSSGRPLDSVDGWPARTQNLAPGEKIEFDFTGMMKFERNMSDFSVSIIEVRNW